MDIVLYNWCLYMGTIAHSCIHNEQVHFRCWFCFTSVAIAIYSSYTPLTTASRMRIIRAEIEHLVEHKSDRHQGT